jgi:hypothetical protein
MLAPGLLVPLLLAIAGVALIIASQLDLDRPAAVQTLPPIPDPTRTASPSVTPAPRGTLPASPTPEPTLHSTASAVQIQIDTFPDDINIPLTKSKSKATDSFPPEHGAYILSGSSEPGRGTNSYIFAHAREGLFHNLWNVQLGASIKIKMSDGAVLAYRVTEIHPNVACQDPDADPRLNPGPGDLPLALEIVKGCAEGGFWTSQDVDHERLTLQTSQGYNRNWGEFVVVAEPAP